MEPLSHPPLDTLLSPFGSLNPSFGPLVVPFYPSYYSFIHGNAIHVVKRRGRKRPVIVATAADAAAVHSTVVFAFTSAIHSTRVC